VCSTDVEKRSSIDIVRAFYGSKHILTCNSELSHLCAKFLHSFIYNSSIAVKIVATHQNFTKPIFQHVPSHRNYLLSNQSQHVHNQQTQNSFQVDSKRKPSRHWQVQGQPKQLEVEHPKEFQPLHRKQWLHLLKTFAVSGMMYKPFYTMSTFLCVVQIYPTSAWSNRRRKLRVSGIQSVFLNFVTCTHFFKEANSLVKSTTCVNIPTL